MILLVSSAAGRCVPGLYQFDGAHAAESADVANHGPALLPIASALLEMLAQVFGALAEILLLDSVDHCKSGGAGRQDCRRRCRLIRRERRRP